MSLRQAAEMAMRALRRATYIGRPEVTTDCESAINALHTALAEAEEPVAARRLSIAEAHEIFAKSCEAAFGSPPRREPLTEEEITVVTAAARDALMDHVYEHGTVAEGQQRFIRQIARAIERAHGIGGDE